MWNGFNNYFYEKNIGFSGMKIKIRRRKREKRVNWILRKIDKKKQSFGSKQSYSRKIEWILTNISGEKYVILKH